MNNKYINNCFNYNGSKDKLLPQIEQHLNFNKKYLIEPFCGSSIVSINFGDKFERCYANDNCWQLIETLKIITSQSHNSFENQVDYYIQKYNLSKDNKQAYYEARKAYNVTSSSKECFSASFFYAILMHSFDYMIQTNKKDEFNNSAGTNRSHFNKNIRKKLLNCSNKLKEVDILFYSYKFHEFLDYYTFGHDGDLDSAMVYVDSPYLASDFSSSRISGNKWTEKHEDLLYKYMQELHDNGAHFLLSNVLENNGKVNEKLLTFANKFNIIEIEKSYKNCNYQRKNKGDTIEIMVKNY